MRSRSTARSRSRSETECDRIRVASQFENGAPDTLPIGGLEASYRTLPGSEAIARSLSTSATETVRSLQYRRPWGLPALVRSKVQNVQTGLIYPCVPVLRCPAKLVRSCIHVHLQLPLDESTSRQRA